MAFQSHNAYDDFAKRVKNDRRFIFENDVEAFLNEVLSAAKIHKENLEPGKVLWRAQLGCNMQNSQNLDAPELLDEIAYNKKRMRPDPEFVTNGRANPLGIAYLYLASDFNTAGSEMRPWLNASISIAPFTTNRSLNLVDCSKYPPPHEVYCGDNFGVSVWAEISRAMSIPFNPEERNINYIPTQIICEKFRDGGFDGVKYRSLLDSGGTN